MTYFLDSVKKEDILEWLPVIEGVTSNPYLLEKEGITTEQFLDMVASIPNRLNKKIFIQVSNMHEVEKFKNKNIIFKVMLHPKHYNFIKELKSKNYQVATTTIYDIVQINQAIEFGVDYTMVYKHKNENPDLFKQAYKLKQISKSNIKLVGASFRGKHEVIDAILSGMDYATVSPQALNEVFNNAQLEDEFNKLYAQI